MLSEVVFQQLGLLTTSKSEYLAWKPVPTSVTPHSWQLPGSKRLSDLNENRQNPTLESPCKLLWNIFGKMAST